MRFKFDENLDARLAVVLESEGHDVDTVAMEGLSGSEDEIVFQACQSNDRVLVTLDLDFSNPFRFPPMDTAGIVVIRPPRPVLSAIRMTLSSFVPQISTLTLKGSLWIVEPGCVRVYDPHEAEA